MEQVQDYMENVVKEEHQEAFLNIVHEWDGGPDSNLSFYKTALLEQFHEDAKEVLG